MRRARKVLSAALVAGGVVLVAASPARALSDEKSGFGVNPAAPFVAAVSTHPAQDILFGITSSTGKPAIAGTSKNLCGAAFKAGAANARFSQKQINAMVDNKAWRESARATIGTLMNIDSEQVVDIGGARGVEFIATPKMGPDHENIAMLLTIVEVPQGRVSFTCALNKAEFQPALGSLRAIRSTITLPK